MEFGWQGLRYQRVMYANLAADCTNKTNVNGADVTDGATPESGFTGVPTIFNHALCQVGFAFRAIGRKNPNVKEIKIVLKDVDIVNINKKGSFTQIPASGAKWTSDHTVAANLASYDYAPATAIDLPLIENTAGNVAATNNYTALATTRILLPQALEDDDDPTDLTVDPIATTTDQKLVVSYTIMIEYDSAPGVWATEEAVAEVYDVTGVKPEEIDIFYANDFIITSHLIAAEIAGYLPKGEGWKYICEGRTAYDGDKPINTNGGRTSFGHAHAASGLADLYECVHQMRGDCGERQVKKLPKTAMLRGYGGAQNICTYIIRTKED